MPEVQLEVSNRDLALFFGSILVALFVIAGATAGWFDPMTAGIAVVTIVAFFAMGQWLESRGIFSSGMSMVWLTLGLGVVMVFAGLVHKGVIPLLVYTNATPLFIEITNGMLYAILACAIIAVVLAVYVVYVRKGLPLGAKKA